MLGWGHPGPECLFEGNFQEKWCGPNAGKPAIAIIKFTKPLYIRGYCLTMGDDCPERDPGEWKIIVDDQNTEDGSQTFSQKGTQDYFDNIAGRYSVVRFALEKPCWTQKIEFQFIKPRNPRCGSF